MVKLTFIVVIIYQEWAAHLSLFAFSFVLFSFFGLQFFLRTKFSSNLSPTIIRFETSLSIISFWMSFMLCVRISAGVIFENIALVMVISLISLVGYITTCFEEKSSIDLMRLKEDKVLKDVEKTQKYLENLCFLYTRAQGNDNKAKLLLSGYIEQIQRKRNLDASCPLLFTSVWKQDRVFAKYIERENRAFLLYISNQYLTALKG